MTADAATVAHAVAEAVAMAVTDVAAGRITNATDAAAGRTTSATDAAAGQITSARSNSRRRGPIAPRANGRNRKFHSKASVRRESAALTSARLARRSNRGRRCSKDRMPVPRMATAHRVPRAKNHAAGGAIVAAVAAAAQTGVIVRTVASARNTRRSSTIVRSNRFTHSSWKSIG